MIRNYLIVALRLLFKNKTFSIINVLGLATGMACCILIALYVDEELSYEKGFVNRDKVFRINTVFIKDAVRDIGHFTSPPIAMEIARVIPEVETATRVLRPWNVEQHIIHYGDKSFFESDAVFVDSTFLDVFPFKLSEGDPTTALDAPSTILISQSFREKVFGDGEAINETIIVNSGQYADTFRITGVVEKSVFPSHADAALYMTMNSNGLGRWALTQTTWANNNMVGGYLKLKNASAANVVEGKLPDLVELHAGEELRQSGRQKILKLQSLPDIHLFSENEGSSAGGGNVTYLYIIATIGVLVLLLACINFMNLTTAKSAQRAGEVGVRKSMGAFRTNLIRQFMTESMIIVFVSLLISFLLVALMLPGFNDIMQKELALNERNLPFLVGATLAISITTGIIAGSYPSFYLSSLKPVDVLKSKGLVGDRSQWLRKGLVVFQFVITTTLISSIVIIQRQLSYIQSKSLGFDAKHVVMVPLRTSQASAQYVGLKESFTGIHGIDVVSGSSSIPSTPLNQDWFLFKEGSSNDKSIRHEIVYVDEDYFQMMDIDLVAGRDFDVTVDNLASDTVNHARVIVNEACLRSNDIPLDDAVGTILYFEPSPGERYPFSIVGVVRDFHQFSLHAEISPMLFILPGQRDRFRFLAVAISGANINDAIEAMKDQWDKRVDQTPFESVFLEDNIGKMYADEKRTSNMLMISTTIAVIISCLGLYGLSVYVAERKTKEIGIRKVVGASVQSIVTMLSGEYLSLILVSFLISIPLGWYAMSWWLQDFAYRIEPGLTVFVTSGVISFAIAWLTISFESLRAATRNPADVLRN
jgi:putative ABC transport system permease protein